MTSYAGREGARFVQAAEQLMDRALDTSISGAISRQTLVDAAGVNASLAQAMATLSGVHEEKQQNWARESARLAAKPPFATHYPGETWRPGDCVTDSRGFKYIRTANVVSPWTGHTGSALADEIPQRPLQMLR